MRMDGTPFGGTDAIVVIDNRHFCIHAFLNRSGWLSP